MTSGIPTARSVDHFAFTVPDLDEAVAFFTEVLGGELLYRLDGVSGSDDDWMAVHLDVDPAARTDIAMLRLGPTSNIELFQYTAPGQNTVPPRNNDVGGHHLGFQVDDVDAAVAHLRRQPGVRVLGEPQTMPEGAPNAGDRWVYFLSPWGMQLEVHSVPDSLPYEKETDGRRFGPAPAWTNGTEPAEPRIPTARNVDHVAYTVADLDASVAFFTDALGAELLYRIGPLELDAGFFSAQLNVHGAGTIEQALLRLGPTDNIELFSYGVPGSGAVPPRNSDVGGHHLAFYVDDVDAAVAYLREVPGVRVLGEPETITDGPIAGDRWVYFTTPIGIQMEVLHMPDGALPYERVTTARRCPGGPFAWTNRP